MNRRKNLWPATILIFYGPWCGAQLYAESAIEKTPGQTVVAADVLDLAEEVGRWLAAAAIQGPQGISWPNDTLHPASVGYDLGSGVAGKAVYFAALHRATGNSDYLDMALGAADYLIAVLDDPVSFADNPRRASLYTGICGIGIALLEAAKLSENPQYDRALEQVIDQLDEWGSIDATGLRWNDEFNDLLYGDTGTTLFLAVVAAQTKDAVVLAMARQGARGLLGEAQDTPVGSYWLFRRSKEFNLPNFSHGTAGVAYTLATVGALTNDEDLLAGAAAGFDYIRSIAEIDNGRLRIPYGWGSDSWDGLFEFGWAHGLAGDAIFFQQLQQVGVEPKAAAEFEELSKHTLVNINLPGVPAEPFAEPSTPFDWRFGRAGALALLSRWAVQSENAARQRDALWSHIVAAAARDGEGVHWQIDTPAFMGGGRAAFTGLLHGAAGIGLAALHMHAAMTDHDPYVLLPDDSAAWADLVSRPQQ